MEWVTTTAKTVEEAQERALDQLGVAHDEAEFDIVEEPKSGLFGLLRGEAKVRARIRPTAVRPKQDRRTRGRNKAKQTDDIRSSDTNGSSDTGTDDAGDDTSSDANESSSRNGGRGNGGRNGGGRGNGGGNGRNKGRGNGGRSGGQQRKEQQVEQESNVTPQEVGDAAVAFMTGLATAMGSEATTELIVEDTDLEVRVSGDDLGLLIGPGGRTLNAVQDLARVAAQRRLGDHETRLRIDVAGYRDRREAALAKFAADVAEQVRTSGTPRSLEAMSSADRKVIHDVLNDEDGVSSRSVGEDPDRRIIVDPA